MSVWDSLTGTVTVEITSAAIEVALFAYNSQGIALMNIQQVNDLVVTAIIKRTDYGRLKKMVHTRGDEIKIINRTGMYWPIKGFVCRPVLLVGMLFLVFLAVFLPSRVLFVEVQGNDEIPSRLIVEKAAQCGIDFGASRRAVRSEKMKNALLDSIPELQWAGVNTYGCTAMISVKERSEVQLQEDKKEVCSIVASRDGIIQQITVLRGNALCKVGQAVKQGQTLVSAYTDCGLYIKAEPAFAEVIASTMRSQNAITLGQFTQRGQLISEEKNFSIKIGKNIINLWKDSGISDASCVKMYEQIPVTLPGGFQLPISLIKETVIYYENLTVTQEDVQSFDWLAAQVREYLNTQMVAGEILYQVDAMNIRNDVCCFQGIYGCKEMIGQVYYERNFQGNG